MLLATILGKGWRCLIKESWILREGTLISVPMKDGAMSPKFPLVRDFEAELVTRGPVYNVYRLPNNGQLVFCEDGD